MDKQKKTQDCSCVLKRIYDKKGVNFLLLLYTLIVSRLLQLD